MSGPDIPRYRDPLAMRLWIVALALLVAGGLAVWAAVEILEPRSDAQLAVLLGGIAAFGAGMFLPVYIEYRRLHGGGGQVVEGGAGSTSVRQSTPRAPTAAEPLAPDRSLKVRAPFLEAEIRQGIRYAWILGWTMTILFGGFGAAAAIVWGFGGPEWLDGWVGAALVFGVAAALGLGGAASNVRERSNELATIRRDDEALAFTVDPIGLRVGLALLLGRSRRELASRQRAVLPIPWQHVTRWVVMPGAGGGSGRRATPPRYEIGRRRDEPVSIERTALAGREHEIMALVKHFVDGEIVLRDHLRD